MIAAGAAKYCAALGNFDGFHRGHQAVLRRCVAIAKKRKCRAVAICFSPHPRQFIEGRSHRSILSPQAKIMALAKSGVAEVWVLRFDRRLLDTEPQEFIKALLGNNVVEIVTGAEFRFGKGRRGDSQWLQKQAGLSRIVANKWRQQRWQCREHGGHIVRDKAVQFSYHPVQQVVYRGAIVSSSRIKSSLDRGELVAAVGLLGSSYAAELAGLPWWGCRDV